MGVLSLIIIIFLASWTAYVFGKETNFFENALKSDEEDPTEIHMSALYDHLKGVIFYKDEFSGICYSQHLESFNSEGSFIIHQEEESLPPEDNLFQEDESRNLTLAKQFCGEFPIYILPIFSHTNFPTRNIPHFKRKKRSVGNGNNNGHKYGQNYPQSGSQSQIQGQVSGQGFFSGQAQSQHSGASQSQVQLSGNGILGSVSSSAGNAQAQIALGERIGSGQAGTLGQGPSSSQVQVNLGQDGRGSMASASVLAGHGGPQSGGYSGWVPGGRSQFPPQELTGPPGQNIYGNGVGHHTTNNGHGQQQYPSQRMYGQQYPVGVDGVYSSGAQGANRQRGIQEYSPQNIGAPGSSIGQPLGHSGYGGLQPGGGSDSFQTQPSTFRQGTEGLGSSGIGSNVPASQPGSFRLPDHSQGQSGLPFSSGTGGLGGQNGLTGNGYPGSHGVPSGSSYHGPPEDSSGQGLSESQSSGNGHGRGQSYPGYSGVPTGVSGYPGSVYSNGQGTPGTYSAPRSYGGYPQNGGRTSYSPYQQGTNGRDYGSGSYGQSSGGLPHAFASSMGGGQAQAQTVYLGSGTSEFYNPNRVAYGSSSYPGTSEGRNGYGGRSQTQYVNYGGASQGQGAQAGTQDSARSRNNGNRYHTNGNGYRRTSSASSDGGQGQATRTSSPGHGESGDSRTTSSDGYVPTQDGYVRPLVIPSGRQNGGTNGYIAPNVHTQSGTGIPTSGHASGSGFLPTTSGFPSHTQSGSVIPTSGSEYSQTLPASGFPAQSVTESPVGIGQQQSGGQIGGQSGLPGASGTIANHLAGGSYGLGGQRTHGGQAINGQAPVYSPVQTHGRAPGYPGGDSTQFYRSPQEQDGFAPSYGVSQVHPDDPSVKKCTIITFTCTIIFESNGRAKICKPAKVNGNGNVGHSSSDRHSNSNGANICCC